MNPRKYKLKNGIVVYRLGKKLHRLDGPAIEWKVNSTEWWINGIRYNNELKYWIAVQNYDKT